MAAAEYKKTGGEKEGENPTGIDFDKIRIEF